jgi:hypothetical protein
VADRPARPAVRHPVDKVAYIEIGSSEKGRRIGFGG